MAKRKSINRVLGRSSRHRSSDSMNSALLDPDTDIVGEGGTFWWNNLEESTPPRYSRIYSGNETARQLNENSQMDSVQSSLEWWKNLETSNSKHATSTKHNFSAGIIKRNILQSSTSESEKESDKERDLRKKKLKATNILRRNKDVSTEDQNPFQHVLTKDGSSDNATRKSERISGSLNLSHPNIEKTISNANEIVVSSKESDESIEILSGKYLKPKSRFIQRTRKSIGKNAFAEALADNNSSSMSDPNKKNDIDEAPRSSSLSPLKRSVNRSNDITHKNSPIHKSPRLSSNVAKKQSLDLHARDNSNADSSGSFLDNNKSRKKKIFEVFSLTPKSRLLQSSRKSVTKELNLFEEIVEENDNISARKSNVPAEDNRASFKRDETGIRIAEVCEAAEMELSPQPRENRTASEKESDDISLTSSSVKKQLDVQAKGNVETDSSSSLDNDESRKKKIFGTTHLKLKSRILESLRKNVNRESVGPNRFEEIFKEDDNISARKSHVLIEDNRTSFKRDESAIRIADVRRSEGIEKSPQTKGNRTTIEEDSDDRSLTFTSSSDQIKKSICKELNVSLEHRNTQAANNNLANLSKSISQKSTIIKTPEKQASFSRKSTRKETLEEHTRINAILPVGRMSINETIRHETVSDDVHDDVDIERDLPVDKRVSESSPKKELRVLLTRCNSSRNMSETPKHANVVREVIDNSRNDANREYDSSVSKQASKSSPDKEARLTRNSFRIRSDTPRSMDAEAHEIVDNSSNNTNKKYDSSVSKRMSKSGPNKEAHLTRNSFRNRSETPRSTEAHEVVDKSRNNTNKEYDSNVSKQVSKSSLGKEARLTRNSFRNQSETPKRPLSKNTPKRFLKSIGDIEEDDVNVDSDISSVSQIISSTRISKVGTSVETRKSTGLRLEMESSDDENAEPARQTIQQNFTSMKAGTSSKTINRQSIQNSNRTSIREGIEMESSDDEDAEPARQTIQQNSTSMKAGTSSKTINRQSIQNSNRTSIRKSREIVRKQKSNSFKSLRKIDDFFKVKQTPTTLEQSSERASKSQVFEKMEKIKTELEKIKIREMAAMNIIMTDKKKSPLKKKDMKSVKNLKQAMKKKPLVNHTRVVNKAFLINGKVYKAPRLPRPKHWATDRFYKFLWNRMEPNYKLATRVKSEKFVQGLAKVVTIIERRKNYETYKDEVNALMQEMARLNIINTRNDFYYFCQDFMPYEFRVKVVPMLMPGNKNNIPYNSELLHVPLLDNTDDE